MGVRVLLIEDDETIAEPLADGLRHFGLTVHHVATGADGLRGPHGDVVLLDLGLPDMDGIDVCRGIRRTSDVPIIILSARGEEADRVLGLELGADDYLAKPFSIRELVARIRAVSRRHQRPGNPGDGVTGEVVAGVVLAEVGRATAAEGTAGVRAGVGDSFGAGFGDGSGLGAGAGSGAGAAGAAEFDALGGTLGGSSAYGTWAASAPDSSGRRGSAAGAGFGGRGRAGSRFGAGSDFSAVGDVGAEGRYRAEDRYRPGDAFGSEGSGRVGDDGPGRSGIGDGRREAGVDAAGTDVDATGPGGRAASVGAGAEYDWSAPYETPAHGTPTYAGPPHSTPVFGSPAPGASAPGGTAYGTPAYGSPAYEPPAYEPPVYEPPMYEQAPPEPRPSSGTTASGDGSAPPPGPLVVDRRTRQVWVGEVPVALTPKEFELLALLTEDPGAVYSRQQILNRVWDDHYQGPTKTLDVHVATLRRKLGDPAWIQTLRGVGFRLAVRTPGQGPGRHRTPEARAS